MVERRVAVVTGVNGQDGSHISDLLIEKGYLVVGVTRRRSLGGDDRIQHLYGNKNFVLEHGDVTDSGSLCRIVGKWMPDEFYNFAAQSYVGLSWKEPVHTLNVTGVGVANCLEAIKLIKDDCKFYQASSSEQFGKVREVPQKETTPFHPRSPYGCAKVLGFEITRNYRESYGIFACNGILFNHEGPRRGLEFVTRKITDAVARISSANGGTVRLGNLDSRRDWGYAPDFVEAAWLMLQQDTPDDYVVATGQLHSIQDLLEVAFSYVGLDWRDHVIQDPDLIRPAEVDLLLGDASKAREKLGWTPKVSFEDMIREMVDEDLKRYAKV